MIFARIENNWPVELRETEWEGSNATFESPEAFDAYCLENEAFRPPPGEVAEPPPEFEGEPEWWWVTKDTIVMRIAAVGDDALLALDQIVYSQPRPKQIIWENASVFRSDNQELRALAGALIPLGVDPDAVLAPDPLAPPVQ